MRSGAASGHVGYFHEAFVYDSDEELLRCRSCWTGSRPASRRR